MYHNGKRYRVFLDPIMTTTTDIEINTDTTNEAIAILKATNDGNQLDPSDLRMLQDVVNGGFAAMTPEAKDYWKKMVETTASGQYKSRWFCGLKDLTRNHEGYVSWKGHHVEHYSFPESRRQEMIYSARRLAAVCMKIESAGDKVDSRTVTEMYQNIEYAEGIETPRYMVLWAMHRDGPILKVEPLSPVSRQLAEIVKKDSYKNWLSDLKCDAMSIRRCQIITMEDLEQFKISLRRDDAWAQSAWSGYRSTFNELCEQVEKTIKPNELISVVDVNRIMVNDFLIPISEASEIVLGSVEFDSARDNGIASRERMAY